MLITAEKIDHISTKNCLLAKHHLVLAKNLLISATVTTPNGCPLTTHLFWWVSSMSFIHRHHHPRDKGPDLVEAYDPMSGPERTLQSTIVRKSYLELVDKIDKWSTVIIIGVSNYTHYYFRTVLSAFPTRLKSWYWSKFRSASLTATMQFMVQRLVQWPMARTRFTSQLHRSDGTHKLCIPWQLHEWTSPRKNVERNNNFIQQVLRSGGLWF